MDNTKLSPGFITIDEGVALIKSDTRANPVVNMDYLIAHVNWVETRHNFRIPRIRRLAPDEVYTTKRGVVKEYEDTKDEYIYIATPFEKELVRKTIYDKYKELVGKEYQALGLRSTSTVADDAEGRDAVRPRGNKPIAKEGQAIGSGETINTNGQGLTV